MNPPAVSKSSTRGSGYHQKALAEIRNSLLPFANIGGTGEVGSSAASTISTLSTTSGISSASGLSGLSGASGSTIDKSDRSKAVVDAAISHGIFRGRSILKLRKNGRAKCVM